MCLRACHSVRASRTQDRVPVCGYSGIDVVANVCDACCNEVVVAGMACSHICDESLVLNHKNLPRGPLILQRTVEPQERTVWRTFSRNGIAGTFLNHNHCGRIGANISL